MGEVWSAQDVLLGRKVAVKVGTGDHRGEVLLREARLAASVFHPNVIGVFDAGREGGRSYVVMELVDGPTLAERLRTGPLEPWEAPSVALQIARALAAAHAEGVVHCDVKPGNVLLDTAGRAVVTDFGIARRTGSVDRRPVYGTVPYLAPEPLAGLVPTSSSDVFSLAVVLVELFSGVPAYSAVDPEGLRAAHAAGPRVPDGLPGELADLLPRCLDLEPFHRPPATEVASTLGPLTKGSAPTGSATMPVRPRSEATTAAIPAISGESVGPAAGVASAEGPTQALPVVGTDTAGDAAASPAAPLPRPGGSPEGPTSRRRRAVAVLAVAGLLLIAAVAGIASFGGSPAPATPAPTRPSPAVTVTPAPSPAATGDQQGQGGGPQGKGHGRGHGKGHGRHGEG
jgi:serine/threonine protein kinase